VDGRPGDERLLYLERGSGGRIQETRSSDIARFQEQLDAVENLALQAQV